MDGRIGDELRQERRARGIELEEIEAATGVRARFLEAIEEEEWERLPGEFYARAFTRTYAVYLGLDPAEFAPERPDPVGEGDDGPRVEPRLVPGVPSARQPRRWMPLAAAAAALALVAAIVLVAALGDGGSTRPSPPAAPGERRAAAPPKREREQPTKSPATSLRLTATAEVWVCLLNGRRKPLIDGQILPPGAEEGPFHSRRYSMSFGNGAVELTVDGARAKTPESSSPVGFAIDERGKLSEIPTGERPECT